MKAHTLIIAVKAPNKLSPKKVAHLVDRLIAIGLDAAWDAYEIDTRLRPSLYDAECGEALKLAIGKCDPTLFKTKG